MKQKEERVDNNKEYLKKKIVAFQLKIAELSHGSQKSEEKFIAKEKHIFLDVFEVLDACENLINGALSEMEKTDKKAKRVDKSVRSIYKKLLRVLKSRDIVQIEFPEKRAILGYCEIVDTKSVPDMENETIVSIIKNGYMNKTEDSVIRPAEVITVLNENRNELGYSPK